MVHASLFSGIGGFDLAAEWMGWENAFHCEINGFCAKVLKYHFPNSKHYADITKTDFSKWRGKIDILTGGFPCQPFSVAGQRKGADDDRYLWPEMLRVIREVRPTWVIGENVGGIITMVQPGNEIEMESQATLFEAADKETLLEQEYVVETVCRDLEHEGYSVQPLLIPACSVGAPHKRDRVWFVANRTDTRNESVQREREDGIYKSEITSDPNSDDAQRRGYGETGRKAGENKTEQKEWERVWTDIERTCQERSITNPSGKRCVYGFYNRRKRYILYDRYWYATKGKSKRDGWKCRAGKTRKAFTYTERKGRRQILQNLQSNQPNGYRINSAGGERDVTNSVCIKFQRAFQAWTGWYEFADSHSRKDWSKFPSQSPVCRGDDGLSPFLDAASLLNGRTPRGKYSPFSHWRKESVKAYGNAIVPQVAYEIFKAIDKVEKTFK